MQICKEDKQKIGAELAACHATQRTYGKQADDLDYLFNIFISDLSLFTAEQIANGLKKWRLREAEFPTVSDIRKTLLANETEAQRRGRLENVGK